MLKENKIWLASSENGDEIFLLPEMANHHGLIIGADNKEVDLTARMIAEGFSSLGISVFMTDIHRNLAGMMKPGNCTSLADKKRLSLLKMDDSDFPYQGYPVTLWDVYGKTGIPLRINISEIGPVLMSLLLQLKKKQYGVLDTIYRIADNRNLLLVDLKDLKATVNYVITHAQTFEPEYGALKASDLEDILRSIVILETNSSFLGEVSFNPSDLVRNGEEGNGMVNVLDCNYLVQERIFYSTILLWLLSEISERMSDTYDLDLPSIVFIIDEARWFFRDDNPEVLAFAERIFNKVRSKGVGIWFCAQKVQDIPSRILPYLENRIQLPPNAFSTLQLKEIRVAASHFRKNPAYDTFEVMKALTSGQALISLVGEDRHPSPVKIGTILPPQSSTEPVSDSDINNYTKNNSLYSKYSPTYDPESAYEILEHLGFNNLKASFVLSNRNKQNIDYAFSESRMRSVSRNPSNGYTNVVYSKERTVHDQQLKGIGVKDFPHHHNDNEKVNLQSDLQEKPLTPQGILKGSIFRIKVSNNKIIIKKNLKDETLAKIEIDKKYIASLHHHKPSLLFKGYISIQFKAGFSKAFISHDSQATQENLQRIQQAFKKELKRCLFVIEYSDSKDPAFHQFIKTLSHDTGVYLFEE